MRPTASCSVIRCSGRSVCSPFQHELLSGIETLNLRDKQYGSDFPISSLPAVLSLEARIASVRVEAFRKAFINISCVPYFAGQNGCNW